MLRFINIWLTTKITNDISIWTIALSEPQPRSTRSCLGAILSGLAPDAKSASTLFHPTMKRAYTVELQLLRARTVFSSLAWELENGFPPCFNTYPTIVVLSTRNRITLFDKRRGILSKVKFSTFISSMVMCSELSCLVFNLWQVKLQLRVEASVWTDTVGGCGTYGTTMRKQALCDHHIKSARTCGVIWIRVDQWRPRGRAAFFWRCMWRRWSLPRRTVFSTDGIFPGRFSARFKEGLDICNNRSIFGLDFRQGFFRMVVF